MKSFNLTEVFNEQNIKEVRGVDVTELNGLKQIIALNKNEIRVIDDKKVIASYPINETFDLIRSIPDHPHLFFLAKNKMFILNPGDEYAELENVDCEFAIFDTKKGQVIERYPLKNSKIYSITSWIDGSGQIKLSGVIGQFYRRKPSSFLIFKKSYADVFDLDLEVVASHLLSKISDEEILSSSCYEKFLVLRNNYDETQFFNLETGVCYLQFINQQKCFWPQSINYRLGELDFISNNSFGVHFPNASYEFDLSGKLIGEYFINIYSSHTYVPRKVLVDGELLAQSKFSFGIAKRANSVHYIMED